MKSFKSLHKHKARQHLKIRFEHPIYRDWYREQIDELIVTGKLFPSKPDLGIKIVLQRIDRILQTGPIVDRKSFKKLKYNIKTINRLGLHR